MADENQNNQIPYGSPQPQGNEQPGILDVLLAKLLQAANSPSNTIGGGRGVGGGMPQLTSQPNPVNASNLMGQSQLMDQLGQAGQQMQAQGANPSGGLPWASNTNPVTGLTDDHIDVLRNVVKKGLTQQAQQFYQQNPQQAQQLIAQHDAAIGSHGGSTSSQPASTQTSQTGGTEATMPQSIPPMSMAPNAGNQPIPDAQTGGISQAQINALKGLQQQANTIQTQPYGFWGSIFRGISDSNRNNELFNNQLAQQAVMGMPSDKAQLAQAGNLNAQTELQNLTNKGEKPIDPEQYLNAYSGMYQKAYDAYAKDEETGNQITQSTLDAYNKLADNTRNALQKGMGQSPHQMQVAMQSAGASLKASIDARTNFHNFMLNNSPAQVIGSIKNKVTQNSSTPATNAQAVTQMLQPGQSKNINGNMIKRLK